jgi:hypothetical protein
MVAASAGLRALAKKLVPARSGRAALHLHISRVAHLPHHVGVRLAERPERLQRGLGLIDWADIGQHPHKHGLAVRLLGNEWHRRRQHQVGDRRNLSGAASAASIKPVITSGVAGKIKIPPTISEISCNRN